MKTIPLLLALLWPGVALPCGGGEYVYVSDALLPPTVHLERELYGEGYWEDDSSPILAFFYPFHPLAPELYDELDAALSLYEGEPSAPLSDAAVRTRAEAFAATATADPRVAKKAAEALIEEILDLPAPLAVAHKDALRAPVEYLEMSPVLQTLPKEELAAWFAGTPKSPLLRDALAVRGLDPSEADALIARSPKNPRMASLRWLSLRHAMQRDIPDGWDAGEIRSRMDEGKFQGLLGQADAWLRDYPAHPLADFVRLKKLRLHYLHGDAEQAWSILFEMYGRHPVRVANEMRFLSRQELTAGEVERDKLAPEVYASLLPTLVPPPDEWSVWWTKAVSSPKESWSMPLQERLLLSIARAEEPVDIATLDAFPEAAAAPTPLWTELRLVALMRAHRNEEAWVQAGQLPADSAFGAPLRAQLSLSRKDWVAAIEQPGLSWAASRYLMRVLAPDAALTAVAQSKDPVLAADAVRELALRSLQATGSWKPGLRQLKAVDPERAELWAAASKLSRKRTPEDRLAYARYLMSQAGKIFAERSHEEIVWYRSLPGASDGEGPPYEVLPLTSSEEQGAIHAWLERSFATWQALVVYAEWLDGLDVATLDGAGRTQARQVLGEADNAYNALLNYGSGDWYAWADTVTDSAPAKTVRRVGLELRQK